MSSLKSEYFITVTFADEHRKVTEFNERFLFRFGSFEIFKSLDEYTGRKGPSVGRTDILHQLLQFTIQSFYPDVSLTHFSFYIKL